MFLNIMNFWNVEFLFQESNADEGANSKVLLTTNLSDQKRFSHANKGQLSRSFVSKREPGYQFK